MPFIMVCFPNVLFPLLICLPLGRVCVKNTLAARPALLLSVCEVRHLSWAAPPVKMTGAALSSPPVGHAAAVLLFTFSEQLSGRVSI